MSRGITKEMYIKGRVITSLNLALGLEHGDSCTEVNGETH